MSDQDLIVIRRTDSPLDGMWYDRKTMKELERIRVPFLETAGRFIMAPTGEFEEREDGERAEVWVPRRRLLAYLLRPRAAAPVPTWPRLVYWTDEMLADGGYPLPRKDGS